MVKDQTKHQAINVALAIVSFLIVVTGVALIGYFAFGDEPEQIHGEVEAREYRVSSKLSGRIVRVMVAEGDYVHAGDTLAILEMPEMDAQKRAAQATERAAQAISEKTDNGNRQEQIQAATEMVKQSEAARDIAMKTYNRMQNLFSEGVVTEQRRDEAQAACQAAEAQVGVARSHYELMVNGSRHEEKRSASEQVKAAKGGVEVVTSLLDETVQVAAVDGEINKIYAHEGELVSNGAPIMSISLLDDVWGKFNIREDELKNIRPGTTVKAYSPMMKREYSLRVYYMKSENDCATWKATKPDEGYDMRTFEVRARPTGKGERFHPGMELVLK